MDPEDGEEQANPAGFMPANLKRDTLFVMQNEICKDRFRLRH